MRAPIFSRGSPTSDVWSDIAQFLVAHERTPPFQGSPFRGHVTFNEVNSGENAPLWQILRNFRVRMPAPHPSKGRPLGHVTINDVTSGIHATSRHAQWYILYYYYTKKKRRNRCACARYHIRSRTSSSGHLTSGDVIPVRAACDDVTSSSTSHHLLKCDFGCADILLASPDAK